MSVIENVQAFKHIQERSAWLNTVTRTYTHETSGTYISKHCAHFGCSGAEDCGTGKTMRFPALPLTKLDSMQIRHRHYTVCSLDDPDDFPPRWRQILALWTEPNFQSQRHSSSSARLARLRTDTGCLINGRIFAVVENRKKQLKSAALQRIDETPDRHTTSRCCLLILSAPDSMLCAAPQK